MNNSETNSSPELGGKPRILTPFGEAPTEEGVVLEFRRIHKAFGPNLIYRELCLQVRQGETLTILGGSGEGKSVLLKCLLGLLSLDGGEIWAFGERVDNLKEADYMSVRRRVGMLFQGAALFDSLSVADNIAYPLVERGVRDPIRLKERVAETLEMVGLPGIEKMRPADLSGGMKKRVGLARAIAIEPEVILYDEPTTGLDPTNVKRINALIRKLQEQLKITSVVVTHDMASAFEISDRFAMLYDHQIEWSGPCAQARHTDNAVVKDFIAGNIGSA